MPARKTTVKDEVVAPDVISEVVDQPAQPTQSVVDVQLPSNATTTIYFNDRAIEFIDGKATVTGDIANALRGANFIL